MRKFYQELPSWLKIIVLNGVIQSFMLAQSWLSGEVANLKMFLLLWIGCLVNILAHLKLNEESTGENK